VTVVSVGVLYLSGLYERAGVIGYLTMISTSSSVTSSAASAIEVLLNNIPKNAGQQAFYVLSIAPLAGAIAGNIDTA
jgi:hypothetical protein